MQDWFREWINARINERVAQRMNEKMNTLREWINKWIISRMNDIGDEWLIERLYEWMIKRMNNFENECMIFGMLNKWVREWIMQSSITAACWAPEAATIMAQFVWLIEVFEQVENEQMVEWITR